MQISCYVIPFEESACARSFEPMTNSPRMGTWRGISPLHFLCVVMFLSAGNSAAVRTEPQSTLMSTSHQGCSNLKVISQCHRYPRRDSKASRISDKHDIHASADYGAPIQDNIDRKAEDNMRSTVVYVSSGVYEGKVILNSKTKPYIPLQGEGRNLIIVTYWYHMAAAAGTFKSTSVVGFDHFRARDILLKYSAEIPTADTIAMEVAAFTMSGKVIAPLYTCNSFGYQGTLYNHGVRFYYFRPLIEDYEGPIFGAARSSQIEICEFYLIANGEEGALKLPGWVWGRCSRVVYSYRQMDARIFSEDWCDWGLLESDRSTHYGHYRCPRREEHTTIRVY